MDSRGGTALPSHYFVVLARCPQAGQQLAQCVHHLDLLSFLLPSQQNRNGQVRESGLCAVIAERRWCLCVSRGTFRTLLEAAVITHSWVRFCVCNCFSVHTQVDACAVFLATRAAAESRKVSG